MPPLWQRLMLWSLFAAIIGLPLVSCLTHKPDPVAEARIEATSSSDVAYLMQLAMGDPDRMYRARMTRETCARRLADLGNPGQQVPHDLVMPIPNSDGSSFLAVCAPGEFQITFYPRRQN
jgi:hypothetical protein